MCLRGTPLYTEKQTMYNVISNGLFKWHKGLRTFWNNHYKICINCLSSVWPFLTLTTHYLANTGQLRNFLHSNYYINHWTRSLQGYATFNQRYWFIDKGRLPKIQTKVMVYWQREATQHSIKGTGLLTKGSYPTFNQRYWFIDKGNIPNIQSKVLVY